MLPFNLCSRRVTFSSLVVMFVLLTQIAAHAQPQDFGRSQRAEAANQLLVLGIQQAISSLPPTSGQTFRYEYNTELDAYSPSLQLEPVAFRTPEVIRAGQFSFRLAPSYFNLEDTFGPVFYETSDNAGKEEDGFTKFGLKLDAKVTVISLGLTYGLADNLEVTLGVPITIVDANAQSIETFIAETDDEGLPIRDGKGRLVPARSQTTGRPILGDAPSEADFNEFTRQGYLFSGYTELDGGTNVGISRISMGLKLKFVNSEYVIIAFNPEIMLPSAFQDEFSGSDSFAVAPRFVVKAPITEAARLYVDAGYEYDADVAQLRRIIWDAGLSIALPRSTLDLGVSGSEYNEPQSFTPKTAQSNPSTRFPQGLTLTALGETELGTSLIDVRLGGKVLITDDVVLSGTVVIPQSNDFFAPDVIGTLGVEYYF